MKTCKGCGKRTRFFYGAPVVRVASKRAFQTLATIEAEGKTRAPGYVAALLSCAIVRKVDAIFEYEWFNKCQLDFPKLSEQGKTS